MPRFGIATMFENCPDGYEFTEQNTPLHVTHVDVLEVDIEPAEFVQMLHEYVQTVAVFDVLPIENTFFGPNKDIPVTLLELSPELTLFHEGLLRFLNSLGAVYDQRRVALGKPLSIQTVSVGNKRTDIENPLNRIITTLPLGMLAHKPETWKSTTS